MEKSYKILRNVSNGAICYLGFRFRSEKLVELEGQEVELRLGRPAEIAVYKNDKLIVLLNNHNLAATEKKDRRCYATHQS